MPKLEKKYCFIGNIATFDFTSTVKKHFNVTTFEILKRRRKLITLQQ